MFKIMPYFMLHVQDMFLMFHVQDMVFQSADAIKSYFAAKLPNAPPPALLCAGIFISTAAQVSQAHQAAPHEYHHLKGDAA